MRDFKSVQITAGRPQRLDRLTGQRSLHGEGLSFRSPQIWVWETCLNTSDGFNSWWHSGLGQGWFQGTFFWPRICIITFSYFFHHLKSANYYTFQKENIKQKLCFFKKHQRSPKLGALRNMWPTRDTSSGFGGDLVGGLSNRAAKITSGFGANLR